MPGIQFYIVNRNHNHLHALLFQADQGTYSCHHATLIILCHGFKGDKAEKNRFYQTAQELNQAGFDVLSFDFSGSGDNQREPILLSRQIADLEDVAKWAKQNGYRTIGTLGLSFGGITSLMAKLPTRKAAVFWSPAMYPQKSISLSEYMLSRILGIFPSITIKRKSSGDHPPILIRSAFIKEIFNLNTDPYLKQFATPSLILQGNADTVVRPEVTYLAYSKMPQDENHKYLEISNAAHDFHGEQLLPFIQHTTQWFLTHLSAGNAVNQA